MEGLRVKDLKISFKNGSSLAGPLSFSIPKNSTLALVGHSGSGKSLTCLAIMDILDEDVFRTEGEIWIGDQRADRLSKKKRARMRGLEIGLISQEPASALIAVETVGKAVDRAYRVHKKRPDREKMMTLLAEMGFSEDERFLKRFPYQLSGGEMQRVMLALALLHEPRLLIADEPTTALDLVTQKKVVELIRQMQKLHGFSMIFVTHDLDVAKKIADRIAVMDRGQIVEIGEKEQILRSPVHEATKQLLSGRLGGNLE